LYDTSEGEEEEPEQRSEKAPGKETQPAKAQVVDLTGGATKQKEGEAQAEIGISLEGKHDGDTADAPMEDTPGPEANARKRKQEQEDGQSPISIVSTPPHTPDYELSQEDVGTDEGSAQEDEKEEARGKVAADKRRLERAERRSRQDATQTTPATITTSILTQSPPKPHTTPDAPAAMGGKKKAKKAKNKGKKTDGQGSIAKLFGKVTKNFSPSKHNKPRPGGNRTTAKERSRSPTTATKPRSRSPGRRKTDPSQTRSQPSPSGGSSK
jgi:hypothetical protein